MGGRKLGLPSLLQSIVIRLADWRDRLLRTPDRPYLGPLLIDRGFGLLYDVERDITWLQDANYAKTVGRTADGEMTWNDAMAWVAGLRYRGITGWRLPDARGPDGSGPHRVEISPEGEIGHLFLVAGPRKSPADLKLRNFEPFSIYWYRNEASATEAWAFKLTGLKQGTMPKDPWHTGEFTVPPTDKVLAWPVHDGDVAPGFLVRFVSRIVSLVARFISDR